MKTLSLKLDDNIFNETEVVLTRIKKSRNRYINEAVDYHNRINKRNLIAHRLTKESKRETPHTTHRTPQIIDLKWFTILRSGATSY